MIDLYAYAVELAREFGIELRMAKRMAQIAACLFLLTFGVGVWVVFARPFGSPRDKALRLCGECGRTFRNVDGTVGCSTTMKSSIAVDVSAAWGERQRLVLPSRPRALRAGFATC